MAGEFLLDTNVISLWYRGEIDLPSRLTGPAYVNPMIVGELRYGVLALNGRRKELLESFLNDAFEVLGVIPIDAESAKTYSILKNEVKTAGRQVPENDLWIAATARQHNLIVVTRDAHFSHFDNLKIESW